MKHILTFVLALLTLTVASAQSDIFVPQSPTAKNTTNHRNVQQSSREADVFCLLLQFHGSDSTYTTTDLDWLDSAYNIGFDRDNPHIYVMTIEGFGGMDEGLTEARVQKVYNYFAMRCHANFPIRYAVNPIHSRCYGDTTEVIRYEVPVERKYYNADELPESRRQLNGKQLDNCVLVTFRHNPDECLGASRGCFVPAEDSTIRGYYASVYMPRGALYSVEGTMDTCPHAEFRLEEHLDYRDLVEHYFLVPHPKQIIVQVGYVVIHSNINREYNECQQLLPDSIFVRFPVSQEQIDNKIRIFGKKCSEKGCNYKTLTTKKVKSKVSLAVQCGVNTTQLDTIFLGKRIQPNELNDYFFEVDNDIETGVFTVEGRHYKAFRVDRHGEYEYRKAFKGLLRITEYNSEEEVKEDNEVDRRYRNDEDIPE